MEAQQTPKEDAILRNDEEETNALTNYEDEIESLKEQLRQKTEQNMSLTQKINEISEGKRKGGRTNSMDNTELYGSGKDRVRRKKSLLVTPERSLASTPSKGALTQSLERLENELLDFDPTENDITPQKPSASTKKSIKPLGDPVEESNISESDSYANLEKKMEKDKFLQSIERDTREKKGKRKMTPFPNDITIRRQWVNHQKRKNYTSEAEFSRVIELEPKEIGPTQNVTIVFCEVSHIDSLFLRDPDVVAEAVAMYDDAITKLAKKYSGYEINHDETQYGFAFPSAFIATGFCIALQGALMQIEWPEKLLDMPFCQLHKRKGKMLYRGFRVKMGVNTGETEEPDVDSVYPAGPMTETDLKTATNGPGVWCERDPKTLRTCYYGSVVDHAKESMERAHGGEILISETVYHEVKNLVRTGCYEERVIVVDIDEIEENIAEDDGDESFAYDIHVRRLVPLALKHRKFKEIAPKWSLNEIELELKHRLMCSEYGVDVDAFSSFIGTLESQAAAGNTRILDQDQQEVEPSTAQDVQSDMGFEPTDASISKPISYKELLAKSKEKVDHFRFELSRSKADLTSQKRLYTSLRQDRAELEIELNELKQEMKREAQVATNDIARLNENNSKLTQINRKLIQRFKALQLRAEHQQEKLQENSKQVQLLEGVIRKYDEVSNEKIQLQATSLQEQWEEERRHLYAKVHELNERLELSITSDDLLRENARLRDELQHFRFVCDENVNLHATIGSLEQEAQDLRFENEKLVVKLRHESSTSDPSVSSHHRFFSDSQLDLKRYADVNHPAAKTGTPQKQPLPQQQQQEEEEEGESVLAESLIDDMTISGLENISGLDAISNLSELLKSEKGDIPLEKGPADPSTTVN